MPIKRENQLTSVKVDTELFTLFKIKCIENKYTLNRLVTSAIALYMTDPEFKEKLQKHYANIEEIVTQLKNK